MERVKWTERTTNEAVLERVGEERMMLKLIRKRKRNWWGHWLRRNCLLKDALEGMVNGRRVILPIGMLPEEALEARIKHLTKYRESHARKFSRRATIQDVFNILLVTSDPVIAQLSAALRNKKKGSLSLDVRCNNRGGGDDDDNGDDDDDNDNDNDNNEDDTNEDGDNSTDDSSPSSNADLQFRIGFIFVLNGEIRKEDSVFMIGGVYVEGNKSLSRGGPVPWPPRSPDFTLDFYLWGHLKAVVYSTAMNNAEELLQRVENACQLISDDNMVFERTRQSCIRRAQACETMEGDTLSAFCKR
ncbi:hypothetical protein ANN_01003 [Periplaneta americana]|uniref:Uncharacterized protein n=1 Tax=Periplaneta americana TaxID=6978 RepID=A0ABQ8TVE3_PERAM|nr:hypothetical protein ANN_01003 [Periplaneta americana]